MDGTIEAAKVSRAQPGPAGSQAEGRLIQFIALRES